MNTLQNHCLIPTCFSLWIHEGKGILCQTTSQHERPSLLPWQTHKTTLLWSIQVYKKESSKILPNVKHWHCHVAHNHQMWLFAVCLMHLLHIRHTISGPYSTGWNSPWSYITIAGLSWEVLQKRPRCDLCYPKTSSLFCFLVQGVKKGDRVSIYLPMIPELVYTMLACARIGAVHSIVVSSFMNGLFIDENAVNA